MTDYRALRRLSENHQCAWCDLGNDMVAEIERLRARYAKHLHDEGESLDEMEQDTITINTACEMKDAEIARLRADKDVQRSIERNGAYEADIDLLEAEIELLRAGAERDAKTIGELQYVLNELLLCEIDDKAEALIRRALENKPLSDIVERAREYAHNLGGDPKDYLVWQLADEIERLQDTIQFAEKNADLRRWKALDKPITAAMNVVNNDVKLLRADNERLREIGNATFMAMCAFRDNNDDEAFQDAIDALGAALKDTKP